MPSDNDYLDFKLGLIEKTYDLYLKRMDLWESWFYQVKYGCITIVIALLSFRYSRQNNVFVSYIALVATIGFWVFEATLRTTFFRYMAKLDIMAEVINNRSVMENALKTRRLDALRILDFDIRTRTLRELVREYIKITSADEDGEDKRQLAEERVFTQKRKLTSIWSSFKLKNAVVFYGALILLQLFALFFFKL